MKKNRNLNLFQIVNIWSTENHEIVFHTIYTEAHSDLCTQISAILYFYFMSIFHERLQVSCYFLSISIILTTNSDNKNAKWRKQKKMQLT
jgi:hypothetical protein